MVTEATQGMTDDLGATRPRWPVAAGTEQAAAQEVMPSQLDIESNITHLMPLEQLRHAFQPAGEGQESGWAATSGRRHDRGPGPRSSCTCALLSRFLTHSCPVSFLFAPLVSRGRVSAGGWVRALTREGVEANPGPVSCRGTRADGSPCDCSHKKSDLRAGRPPSAAVDGEVCTCGHKVYQHDDPEVSFGSGEPGPAAASANPGPALCQHTDCVCAMSRKELTESKENGGYGLALASPCPGCTHAVSAHLKEMPVNTTAGAAGQNNM